MTDNQLLRTQKLPRRVAAVEPKADRHHLWVAQQPVCPIEHLLGGRAVAVRLGHRDHYVASPKRVLPPGQTARGQELACELHLRHVLAPRGSGPLRELSEGLAAEAVLGRPRAHLRPPITVDNLALRFAGVVGDPLPAGMPDRDTHRLELRLALENPPPPLREL